MNETHKSPFQKSDRAGDWPSPRRSSAPRDRATIPASRLLVAVAAGFSATIACVAAATEPAGPAGADVHPLTATAALAQGTSSPGGEGTTPLADSDAGPGDSGKPDGGCPYGALEDPHRGFVRCLAQGEKSPFPDPDAGTPGDAGDGGSPPPSDGGNPPPGDGGSPTPLPSDAGNGSTGPTPPDAGADAGPPPPPAPGPLPVVEMKAPKFENGDVPKAEKNLTGKKVLEAIAKCVSDAGGLTGKTGSLKVEFLVRSRGKAEGVEVKGTGVPAEAARCVQTFLKNRSVGTPSADPTGVTVVYSLKPSGK